MHNERSATGFFGLSGSVSTMGDRLRYIAQAQFPFLAVLGVVSVCLAIADRSRVVSPSFVLATAFSVVLSVGALFLPWERLRRGWVWLIATGDFVVVALLSETLSEVFPAIIVLIVFPVMWMAYEFGVRSAPISVLAGVVVTVFSYTMDDRWPLSPLEIANLAVRLAFLLLFAVSVGVMSDLLRASRRMVRDISAELRSSLAAAEDRELTLRTVIDTVDAAIVVMDATGGTTIANESARAQYKKSNGRIDSNGPREGLIFHRDRVTPVAASEGIIARALRDAPLAGRVYWLGEGDEQIAVSSAARKVRRADGEILGTVVVGHDVTALVEAVTVRDEFLSTVSHELKTPLTNIIGYLDMIDGTAPQIATELAVIQKNADRLLALVAELLTAGGTTSWVHRLPADVADITSRKLDLLRDDAARAHVMLTAVAAPSIIAEVDPEALRTIIGQLVSNALKFTPAGGKVTVAVTRDDHFVWLRVADTGIGISHDHQRQVFDRFFRAPTARQGAVPGTGLGLSIVKALVDAHHGSISLTSELGDGTTVVVGLPLDAADRTA